MDKYKVIDSIRRKVQKDHPGIERDLKRYMDQLKKELKKAGIDPTKVNVAYITDSAADLSAMLDELVLEPIFRKQAGSMENTVVEALIMYGSSKKIEETLLIPKLFFFSIASLFFLAALWKLRRNPLYAIIYFGSAADCFRITYNCYVPNYFSLAAKNFVSTPGAVVNTFVAWAQKAIGAIVTADDPLTKLKKSVDWKILFENTIVKYLYFQVAHQFNK